MTAFETFFVAGKLYRLPAVLDGLGISKSAWWAGVKDGRFPQPVKLGPRTTAWRGEDLLVLTRNGAEAN